MSDPTGFSEAGTANVIDSVFSTGVSSLNATVDTAGASTAMLPGSDTTTSRLISFTEIQPIATTTPKLSTIPNPKPKKQAKATMGMEDFIALPSPASTTGVRRDRPNAACEGCEFAPSVPATSSGGRIAGLSEYAVAPGPALKEPKRAAGSSSRNRGRWSFGLSRDFPFAFSNFSRFARAAANRSSKLLRDVPWVCKADEPASPPWPSSVNLDIPQSPQTALKQHMIESEMPTTTVSKFDVSANSDNVQSRKTTLNS
ncbi:MAG: hypothetical protein PVI41_07130 [Roseobacter sp.]